MIIKFVMKFLPTCLLSGLTVAAPDAFGRIPGVLCTRFDICSPGRVKSGEGHPNRVASVGLNRAYMKIRTPSSCYTDNTIF